MRYTEHQICAEHGWTYDQWAALPHVRRVSWIAFYTLKMEVEGFEMNRDQLKKLKAPGGGSIELTDWMEWSAETREFKLEMARKMSEGA